MRGPGAGAAEARQDAAAARGAHRGPQRRIAEKTHERDAEQRRDRAGEPSKPVAPDVDLLGNAADARRDDGRPGAIASSTASGQWSPSDGSVNTSAAAYQIASSLRATSRRTEAPSGIARSWTRPMMTSRAAGISWLHDALEALEEDGEALAVVVRAVLAPDAEDQRRAARPSRAAPSPADRARSGPSSMP